MFIPAKIHVKNKKITSGHGILSNLPINADSGDYLVLGVLDKPTEEELTTITKGKPLARIIATQPGQLVILEGIHG